MKSLKYNFLTYDPPTYCGRIFANGIQYGIDQLIIVFPFLSLDIDEHTQHSFCSHMRGSGITKTDIFACEGKECILEFPFSLKPIILQTVSGIFRLKVYNQESDEWRAVKFILERIEEHWIHRLVGQDPPIPTRYGCWPIPVVIQEREKLIDDDSD